MTQTEMEHRFENLDHRLARIEQILPTLGTRIDLGRFATKEDFERFATREDLERFATKEDLERFATREDLERFATKEDLERFATKEDLHSFATRVDLEDVKTFARVLNEETRGDVRILAEAVAVLTVNVDGVVRQLASLTERLEHKGVI